jgi:hypothetical protein
MNADLHETRKENTSFSPVLSLSKGVFVFSCFRDNLLTKVERFRVQRSGLKKPDHLLLADYVFLALIVASLGEFEHLELSSPLNAGSSNYNL